MIASSAKSVLKIICAEIIATSSVNRISGGSRNGPIKQGLSVLPSVLLSRRSLGILSLVISEFQHDARNPYEVVRGRARFSGFFFFFKHLEKYTKHGPKTGFYNLLKDLILIFFLNLCFNENLFTVLLHKSYIWKNLCP